MTARTITFMLLPVFVLLPACSQKLARIRPYERGTFAKNVMADAPDPLLAAMTEHAYYSREATHGGRGVGGGGCGCN